MWQSTTSGRDKQTENIYVQNLTQLFHFRALENILESGDPGVHSFANSVYKVGRDDGSAEDVVHYDDGDSDSYSEDSEQCCEQSDQTNIFNRTSPFQQNFVNQPQHQG